MPYRAPTQLLEGPGTNYFHCLKAMRNWCFLQAASLSIMGNVVSRWQWWGSLGSVFQPVGLRLLQSRESLLRALLHLPQAHWMSPRAQWPQSIKSLGTEWEIMSVQVKGHFLSDTDERIWNFPLFRFQFYITRMFGREHLLLIFVPLCLSTVCIGKFGKVGEVFKGNKNTFICCTIMIIII